MHVTMRLRPEWNPISILWGYCASLRRPGIKKGPAYAGPENNMC